MTLLEWVNHYEDRKPKPARQWLMEKMRERGVDIYDKRLHELVYNKKFPKLHEAEVICAITGGKVYKQLVTGLREASK